MLESGYIRMYRSLVNWEWYTDTNTKVVFLHLLLTANYESKKWKGITVERGQRVITYQKLADELQISAQSVRTALKHLESTGELTYCSYPRYGVISLSNYDKYQSLTQSPTPNQQETNIQTTSNQQASNIQSTAMKESNKAIKKKENTSGSTPAKKTYGEYGNVTLTDEQYDSLIQRLGKGRTDGYIDRLDGYIESKGAKYKNHCATILNWVRKDGEKPSVPQKQGQGFTTSSFEISEVEKLIQDNFNTIAGGAEQL